MEAIHNMTSRDTINPMPCKGCLISSSDWDKLDKKLTNTMRILYLGGSRDRNVAVSPPKHGRIDESFCKAWMHWHFHKMTSQGCQFFVLSQCTHFDEIFNCRSYSIWTGWGQQSLKESLQGLRSRHDGPDCEAELVQRDSLNFRDLVFLQSAKNYIHFSSWQWHIKQGECGGNGCYRKSVVMKDTCKLWAWEEEKSLKQMPGWTRPARPRLWAAAALDTHPSSNRDRSRAESYL